MKKFLAYIAILYVASNLSYWGLSGPIQLALFLGVIVFPTLVMTGAIWKMLRFFYFPTPSQLMRGFRNIWPVVKRGPIVTRVKRHP